MTEVPPLLAAALSSSTPQVAAALFRAEATAAVLQALLDIPVTTARLVTRSAAGTVRIATPHGEVVVSNGPDLPPATPLALRVVARAPLVVSLRPLAAAEPAPAPPRTPPQPASIEPGPPLEAIVVTSLDDAFPAGTRLLVRITSVAAPSPAATGLPAAQGDPIAAAPIAAATSPADPTPPSRTAARPPTAVPRSPATVPPSSVQPTNPSPVQPSPTPDELDIAASRAAPYPSAQPSLTADELDNAASPAAPHSSLPPSPRPASPPLLPAPATNDAEPPAAARGPAPDRPEGAPPVGAPDDAPADASPPGRRRADRALPAELPPSPPRAISGRFLGVAVESTTEIAAHVARRTASGAVLASPLGVLAVAGLAAPEAALVRFLFTTPAALDTPDPIPQKTGTWKALKQAITVLESTAPELGRQILGDLRPENAERLAAVVRLAVAAAAGKAPSPLIDEDVEHALVEAGRADLLTALQDESAPAPRRPEERSGDHWHVVPLPFFDGETLRPAWLHLERERPRGRNHGEGASRFVLEVGKLQLDGLLRPRRFDLMLRSPAAFDVEMRGGIDRLFRATLDASGWSGEIGFSTAPAFNPPPRERLSLRA